MRYKVSRLQNSPVIDASVTLIRSLAKDGLMEDGKEELLQRMSIFVVKFRVIANFSQWVVRAHAVNSYLSI